MKKISEYVFVRANGGTAGVASTPGELTALLSQYVCSDDDNSMELVKSISDTIFAGMQTPDDAATRTRVYRSATTGRYTCSAYTGEDEMNYDEDVVADIYKAAYTGECNILARITLLGDRVNNVTLSRHASNQAVPLNVAIDMLNLTGGEILNGEGRAVVSRCKPDTRIVSEDRETLTVRINDGMEIPVTSIDDVVECVREKIAVDDEREIYRLVGILWTDAKQRERGRYFAHPIDMYRSPNALPYILNGGVGRSRKMYHYGRIFQAFWTGGVGPLFTFNAGAMVRNCAEACYVTVLRHVGAQASDPSHICQVLMDVQDKPEEKDFELFPIVSPAGGYVVMLHEQDGWKLTAQVCSFKTEEEYAINLQKWIDKQTTLLIDLGREHRTFLLYSRCTPPSPATTSTANEHKRTIKHHMQLAAWWYIYYANKTMPVI